MKKRAIITFVLAGLLGLAQAQDNSVLPEHIQSVTAISRVLGDGRKVATVVLEYDTPISNKSLDINSYRVEGKDVMRVYANTAPERAEKGRERSVCHHRSEGGSGFGRTTQTTHACRYGEETGT